MVLLYLIQKEMATTSSGIFYPFARFNPAARRDTALAPRFAREYFAIPLQVRSEGRGFAMAYTVTV
jgi:hypothetical protein